MFGSGEKMSVILKMATPNAPFCRDVSCKNNCGGVQFPTRKISKINIKPTKRSTDSSPRYIACFGWDGQAQSYPSSLEILSLVERAKHQSWVMAGFRKQNYECSPELIIKVPALKELPLVDLHSRDHWLVPISPRTYPASQTRLYWAMRCVIKRISLIEHIFIKIEKL